MTADNLERAKRIIDERVELFARNQDQYRRSEYKEAQLRVEFLDPLFEALGWDVANRQGWAEQYKEVVNEDALKAAGATQAPDYSFRIGGVRKFFVEAKKPAHLIKADASAAYQLRRYAWSAKLPVSILTDFQELAVYDCRQRPSDADAASVGRINFYTYDQYLDRWPEIYDVFSKDAVLRGSFDRFLQGVKAKRGTTPVDAEFLKEIEGWRERLAKNVAPLNPRLTLDELNDAVQRTIDRIIFLRMAEDRGTEEYGQLQRLIKSENIYAGLLRLCQQADAKYNSGLFDFAADTLTPHLKIDDEKLSTILADLYYPKSPYEFSVLGADTLGNVYEQFLGKVIRLTPSHQAKVEEKPEVKKAGGVYYTPTYIVDYIVKQTVGNLIEGKSPKQIEKLHFLDPACGSGSFLLGAYQLLLDYHLNWYREHAAERGVKDRIYQSVTGWQLTTAEKKRILLNNIYGVDIDRQAVEVTKLSLLLKVLEGENQETLGKQIALFRERALPNLDRNIKCGNSLIGPDYFAGRMFPDVDDLRRVNPFDWQREFPEIMHAGGFDCVIGNPPYVRIQMMREWAPLEVEIYKQLYQAARSGNYDIYVVFVEKGLTLLNKQGRLGFILPHKFFNAHYGQPLRELISRGRHLAMVVNFGDQQVFPGATTYTCLMFLNKAGVSECRYLRVDDLGAWRNDGKATEGTIPTSSITRAEWNLAVGTGAALFEKLSTMPVKLGAVASIFVGLQTSADLVFLFKNAAALSKKTVRVHSQALDRDVLIETALLKSVVRSGEIGRYWARPTALVLFPYRTERGRARLIPENELEQGFPRTWEYLLGNKQLLANREHGRFKSTGWYQLYPKNLDVWEQSKILIPYMTMELAAYYDSENLYFVNVTTGGFGMTVDPTKGDIKYFTGLLNSHLLDWFFKKVSTTFHGGYFAANKQYLVQLPLPDLDLLSTRGKASHDRIVVLVEQMLDLHQRLRAAATGADRELFQRQIDGIDKQIDTLVNELYGLTDEEIRIVEGEAV